ncbi:hypothetical protein A6J80_09755 [Paracoccus yeei]|uniref:Arc family DNA-binding protein n=1 Tax=Paracoccus yeei TaxID=147645 RepID=A0A1V0GS13_9RHOB|nr:hypothetical protein [Paracoccus yeei]ARC36632.1 hypothetical protein A6J80_09755 [Paracoccus yeei]
MAKQDDYTRYTIRIPTPLYNRVKAAAGDGSVNTEIIAILKEKYPDPDLDRGSVVDAIQDILSALTNDPPERWRDCVSHFADRYNLNADAFDVVRDWSQLTVSYTLLGGNRISMSADRPMEDALAGWLAQVEHAETQSEQQDQLAELNRFLGDGDNSQFEAVIDTNSPSPRRMGWRVVLRLKP